MARKTVKTIGVTIGSVSDLALASAPAWGSGVAVETDAVAAYNDDAFTNVPRPVKSFKEATFTFIDEGDGKNDSVAALVGTVVSVVLSSTYWDGKTTGSPVALTQDMAIKSCEPGEEVEVDGERKSTFVVVAVKHAPAAAAAAAQNTNSGTGSGD